MVCDAERNQHPPPSMTMTKIPPTLQLVANTHNCFFGGGPNSAYLHIKLHILGSKSWKLRSTSESSKAWTNTPLLHLCWECIMQQVLLYLCGGVVYHGASSAPFVWGVVCHGSSSAPFVWGCSVSWSKFCSICVGV